MVELGLNVTVMVQVPLTATLAGQLLVSVKSPATVPLATILLMLKAAAPVFCNVDICEALAVLSGTLLKVRLGGVKVTKGVVPGAPVPVSATVCRQRHPQSADGGAHRHWRAWG